MFYPARFLILIVSLLVLTACGGINLTGIWVGSGTVLNDNSTITGSITITQTDDSFTGSLTFAGNSLSSNNLPVGGTINGSTLTFVGNISGSANVSGDTMKITASATTTNNVAVAFTFTANRQ